MSTEELYPRSDRVMKILMSREDMSKPTLEQVCENVIHDLKLKNSQLDEDLENRAPWLENFCNPEQIVEAVKANNLRIIQRFRESLIIQQSSMNMTAKR